MNALCAALLLVTGFQDLEAELKKLEEDYQKEMQAFMATYQAAKTPQERGRLYQEKYPDPLFFPRFQDLAKRAKGTPAAPAALAKVFEMAGRQGKNTVQHDALKEMVASHLDSPLLERMAVGVGYTLYHSGFEGLLRSLMDKSPHRNVRAAAQLSLAGFLVQREDASPEAKAESRRLYEGVIKDFADTPYAKQAEGKIFEQDNLQVGKVAPDFEAVDQDGKPFKLSDYRGKVVVLDFWGFW